MGVGIADMVSNPSLRPRIMSVNCNGTQLAVVDRAGILRMYDLPSAEDCARHEQAVAALPSRGSSGGANNGNGDRDRDRRRSDERYRLPRGGDRDRDRDGGNGDGDASSANRALELTAREWKRKDAWEVVWAEDNPDLLAVMEKTKMFVFRALQPEDPVLSSGYIARFKDLEVTSVMLDAAMRCVCMGCYVCALYSSIVYAV